MYDNFFLNCLLIRFDHFQLTVENLLCITIWLCNNFCCCLHSSKSSTLSLSLTHTPLNRIVNYYYYYFIANYKQKIWHSLWILLCLVVYDDDDDDGNYPEKYSLSSSPSSYFIANIFFKIYKKMFHKQQHSAISNEIKCHSVHFFLPVAVYRYSPFIFFF